VLAARVGIEDTYRDAAGQIQHISAETKRLLLAAMGIKADDERQAHAAVAAFDRAEWARPVPQVCVVCTDRLPLAVDVNAPAGTSTLEWHLSLEEGGERAGITKCGPLTLKETHTIDGRHVERHQCVLPGQIPQGYHRFRTTLGKEDCSLIVTPRQCWVPPLVDAGRRLWGVAAQLYLLRSTTNWGIGDFTDLRQLVLLLKARGADVVGLNPLHALFIDKPEQASPYSPESRLLLNVLNIDVEAVPAFDHAPEAQRLFVSEDFQRRLRACRAASMVDYSGVASLKVEALQLVFESCASGGPYSHWDEFLIFRREQGIEFEQSCLYEALRQHFARIDESMADWHGWPPEYRDPRSPAVVQFGREQAKSVTFHAWMQWVADSQLAEAAVAAQDMEVGLYRDLAVGTDRSGAATWRNPQALVSDAQVGAPPDLYNATGQDWGLPPFHPRALRESCYRTFIELVRANMRHAGGLRIDHVMALQHLYWVPRGRSPAEGAYVKYPLDDLVGILALESHRHQCLVVGEDLGTVPDGFRERMAEASILSYRVLFFEQDLKTGRFFPPDQYPRLALAVTGSHDLPTLRGWWEGADLDLKERLHQFPQPDQAEHARAQRVRDRLALLQALRHEGLLPNGGQVTMEQLSTAVHHYLARTKAFLAIVQLDDITDETESVNVPATTDEHPNWRRRVSLNLEDLSRHPRLDRLARLFQEERGADSEIRPP
jgi:4-alpha-glucanotransferase